MFINFFHELRSWKIPLIGAGVALCVLPLAAIAAEDAVQSRAGELVRRSPGAANVFAAENGQIRHLQSGLICKMRVVNSDLAMLQVYPSSNGVGSDVGCDYTRTVDGEIVSKLTIYAVRVPDTETLDSAFARYEGEFLSVFKNARYRGYAVKYKADNGNIEPLRVPDVLRSAEYEATYDGHPVITQIAVSVRSGWVLEVRSTYHQKSLEEDDGAISRAWSDGLHSLIDAQDDEERKH